MSKERNPDLCPGLVKASGCVIAETEWGHVVFGSIPVDQLVALTKTMSKEAVISPGIANFYKANSAYPRSPLAAKEWKSAIAQAQGLEESKTEEEKELLWLNGADTGLSSETIFSVLAKNKRFAFNGTSFAPGYTPSDHYDFGRCSRLLALFPDWRARLGEVADKYPAWAPLVKRWDELESVYAKGDYEPTTAVLYEIEGKRRSAKAKEGQADA